MVYRSIVQFNGTGIFHHTIFRVSYLIHVLTADGTDLLQEIAAAGTKRLHHVEPQSPVGTLGSRAGTIRKRGTLGGGGRGGDRDRGDRAERPASERN